MANPKLFRADIALYFPNLQGRTLKGANADTTDVLTDKVSVLSIFSSQWAEAQKNTFVGDENPQLESILQSAKDVAQKVEINMEVNPLRAMVLRMFEWNLRRVIPESDHGKYFIRQRSISNEVRHTIGLLNSKVGYVYLIDGACRIRWAASGGAEGEEREYLNRGLTKLIDEARKAPIKN